MRLATDYCSGPMKSKLFREDSSGDPGFIVKTLQGRINKLQRGAPDWKPKRAMAVATANSKKGFEAETRTQGIEGDLSEPSPLRHVA